MYYFDKDFYLINLNFKNLNLKLIKNIFIFIILILISIFFKSYIFLPLILIPIALDLILFLINLGISDDLYKKVMKKKSERLNKIKDSEKNDNYYLNEIIIKYELKQISINKAIAELNKLNECEEVSFAKVKFKIINAYEHNLELNNKEKDHYIKIITDYTPNSQINSFEKYRMFMLLGEYETPLSLLEKDKTKSSISNLGFIFYKYIILYLIYDKYNDTKKDVIYQKIKNFFFISKFKIYFDNAVSTYNNSGI
ncbi:hypothetical protein ANASTE_02255 [Anaerofustis stercorihominis DSM 17244]|uniref:Uncharacterized protein n=1 Tax=Anaerofustis stercorihominis DSM 17244 TaxID=445971 RepID=B1C9G2_9FIRM|nr:hypothetical protein [Anaerofustis stercorihominis]EDS72533.1 hypothetical protein ANASTE_02255 [Anaerofustis stercorihominis DSM 17244]